MQQFKRDWSNTRQRRRRPFLPTLSISRTTTCCSCRCCLLGSTAPTTQLLYGQHLLEGGRVFQSEVSLHVQLLRERYTIVMVVWFSVVSLLTLGTEERSYSLPSEVRDSMERETERSCQHVEHENTCRSQNKYIHTNTPLHNSSVYKYIYTQTLV